MIELTKDMTVAGLAWGTAIAAYIGFGIWSPSSAVDLSPLAIGTFAVWIMTVIAGLIFAPLPTSAAWRYKDPPDDAP